MKDYKYFMGVLMESDVMVDKPIRGYTHMIDIERNFQSGEYFKAMMHLSCLIESNLYRLLLLKLQVPPNKFLSKEVKKMQEVPLKTLIDWVTGKSISKKRYHLVCSLNNWETPLINEEEKSILYRLKNMRNEIAHIPHLTYDRNLKKEVIKKLIDDTHPIHNKLVEEIIKITNENKK